MSSAPATRTQLILAFATIYLVWGSTYLGMRIAIETMPPFLMAGARFLLAGLILLAFLRARGAAWPTAHQWRDNTVIGLFLLLGGNGLVAWSEQFVPSGIAALVIGVSPLFFVLVEWAWPGGKRPGAITWLGLALGFVGVAWLAAPWQDVASGGLDPFGTLAILTGSILWAFGSIYSKHRRDPAPPMVGAAAQMLGGSIGLLVTAALTGEFGRFDPAALSARSVGAFTYLVFIGSLVGFSTFVWLMKHTTPARVSTYAYVNPVVAVFLGWLVVDEPIGPRTLVASAIIIAAVVIITAQKNRRPSPAPSAPKLPSEPRLSTSET